MAYRSIAWLMSQAAAAPTANPTAGPSRRTCTENSAQSATPDASALATAIRIRSMGKTTTSLVPASMFRAWRMERGMRPLRTTSRRTTGSVEARMVPRSSDSTIEVPSKKYDPAATTETMIRVPGPRESTGTAPAPSMLSLPILTPSRQRTRASVSVATDIQKRVLRAEHEDAQTVLPEQKSQTQKDYRKRDWGSLHEPRGETCDGEDHGDQSKGREQVGQRRLS